jgi:hypothetical protein
MQSFEDTRADQEFQQRIAQARAGWMDRLPAANELDLRVEGLRGSLLRRLVYALQGRRN